ncbi:hypothetical protein [Leptolyngbya iicbica]|uniref:ADP-ribosylglycohydrolase family protein n=2 Tax=Cyanophyceae TaxID=3028117 RepID=A0A4Q7E8L1_9CYAN|nr:hypothetical protein [Leptolyngbya sp. LK]RZM77171.1 hypothetical protein DYY88_16100 [Leptolyngbya sp. LK]
MVSFRNSQFQAILVGMVMADAISQGQLPWGTVGEGAGAAAQRWSEGAIAQADWCHAIAATLTRSTPSPISEAGAIGAEPETVVDLLADLPRLLSMLDRPPSRTACGDASQTTLSALFYDCLQASLRQDVVALGALRQQISPDSLGAKPSPPMAALRGALELLLTAQGDFQLAVGQGLQSPTAPSGSVLLTAILSAGWGDLPSLPIRHRHWLQQPSPFLQNWLQQRWQIATATQLALWAETLWQRWSGQYGERSVRSPLVAIQPLVPAAHSAYR